MFENPESLIADTGDQWFMADIQSSLAFPSAKYVLESGGWPSNLKSWLILHLSDESLWILCILGSAWTKGRVERVIPILIDVGRGGISHFQALRTLRLTLKIANLKSVSALNVNALVGEWGPEISQCEAVAKQALRRKSSVQPAGTQPESPNFSDFLESWIDERVSALDPYISNLATVDNAMDLRLYSYLAHPSWTQYRTQAFRSIPLLVREAVDAEPSGEAGVLKAAIDNGMPIIKFLSARWHVPPGVIRLLIHLDLKTIGSFWKGDYHSLAMTLAALPNDYYPKSTHEWRNFNLLLRRAESEYGGPAHTTFLALSYLRQMMVLEKDGERSRENADLIAKRAIQPLENMRHALIGYLLSNFCIESSSASSGALKITISLVERFFAGLGYKGGMRKAEHYQQLYDGYFRDADPMNGLRAGILFWPLIPEPLVVADGTRRIEPLNSEYLLRQHGRLLSQCTAHWTDVVRYCSWCKTGDTYILGVFEAESHKALSTIHIKIREARPKSFSFEVKEHKAANNAAPAASCRKACNELLEWCKTNKATEHIERGRELIAEMQERRSRLKNESILLLELQAKSLMQTLGEEVLADLERSLASMLEIDAPMEPTRGVTNFSDG